MLLAASSCACGGKKNTAYRVPPAPPIAGGAGELPPTRIIVPAEADEPEKQSVPGIHVDPNSPILWSEVGYASWYGPNYHGRKAANGEIYDQHQMTAAHNTLPLNSIVRVINVKTGQSTVVRITDRGPFIVDRIIDLSKAAAKEVGVYLPGTAKVRVEVLETPRPIESGGRWCVQIGAMQEQAAAQELKNRLLQRYSDADVIKFKGPTGYWVRIRVPKDDKEMTRQVFDQTEVYEGGVFMVRLD